MSNNFDMFNGQIESIRKEHQKNLIGLRVCCVLLFALGALLGIYVLFYLLLLVVSLVRMFREVHHQWHCSQEEITLAVVIVVTASLAYVCFRAAVALEAGKRWAAYVAMAFGAMLLLFSGLIIYDWCHPERQSADEGFVVLVLPFFIATGLWWCIYLNLPDARAYFTRASQLR